MEGGAPVGEDAGPVAGPPPIVFVGGTGRSGTHVVAKLLGRSRELEDIRMEVRFHCDPGGFPDLLSGEASVDEFVRRLRGFWWRRYRGGGRPPDILPWLSLGREPRGLHKIVEREHFEDTVADFEMATIRAMLNESRAEMRVACRTLFVDMLWPIAIEKQVTGLVEMSCDNVAQADALRRLFPEAKFIHVVRDGRDASASRVQQGRHLLYPRTRSQGLQWWEQRVRRIERELGAVAPEQVHTVSLDMLVQPWRQRRGLKALLEFVGLHKQPRIRRYFRRHISPEVGNLGRWRQGLSRRRQERLRAEYEEVLDRMELDRLRCAPLLREVYESERELAAAGAPPPGGAS